MQLSKFTDYSLRLLMFLVAHQGRWVSTAEISTAFDISFHHVAKVAQSLVRLGWTESVRGRSGGLRLVVDPSTVSVGDLVRHLEDLRWVECFDPASGNCVLHGNCVLEKSLHRAQQAFLTELDQTSLADLVAGSTTTALHQIGSSASAAEP